MTLNELMEKILEILPDARIGTDPYDGELEVYTGFMIGEKVQDIPVADYALVKFEEKE